MSIADHEELARLYGPWQHRSPADVLTLLDGYTGDWWIAGGWAIEAFTENPRPHGDIDVGIPRGDVAHLLRHLQGLRDVWAADRGTLRPLMSTDAAVPNTCGNLWLRASGAEPWEYDIILTDTDATRWSYKRDPRVALPFDRVLWRRNGIDYLRPEIQLLYKAPGMRMQDQQDFDASAPLLERTARVWLQRALQTAHPGHPWIEAL